MDACLAFAGVVLLTLVYGTADLGQAPAKSALLVGAGIITALPLMAFAAATQRLDLAMIGMLMYINPTMQFLTAIYLFDEPLQTARLVSFGLIWLGLLLYSSNIRQKFGPR